MFLAISFSEYRIYLFVFGHNKAICAHQESDFSFPFQSTIKSKQQWLFFPASTFLIKYMVFFSGRKEKEDIREKAKGTKQMEGSKSRFYANSRRGERSQSSLGSLLCCYCFPPSICQIQISQDLYQQNNQILTNNKETNKTIIQKKIIIYPKSKPNSHSKRKQHQLYTFLDVW